MVFSLDIGVEPSLQVLGIPMYACGLHLGLALISSEILIFNGLSITSEMIFFVVVISYIRQKPDDDNDSVHVPLTTKTTAFVPKLPAYHLHSAAFQAKETRLILLFDFSAGRPARAAPDPVELP